MQFRAINGEDFDSLHKKAPCPQCSEKNEKNKKQNKQKANKNFHSQGGKNDEKKMDRPYGGTAVVC